MHQCERPEEVKQHQRIQLRLEIEVLDIVERLPQEVRKVILVGVLSIRDILAEIVEIRPEVVWWADVVGVVLRRILDPWKGRLKFQVRLQRVQKSDCGSRKLVLVDRIHGV